MKKVYKIILGIILTVCLTLPTYATNISWNSYYQTDKFDRMTGIVVLQTTSDGTLSGMLGSSIPVVGSAIFEISKNSIKLRTVAVYASTLAKVTDFSKVGFKFGDGTVIENVSLSSGGTIPNSRVNEIINKLFIGGNTLIVLEGSNITVKFIINCSTFKTEYKNALEKVS